MNMDTVLKCAQMAARQQEAFLGNVDQDIQDLLAELTPAAPVAEPMVETAPEPVVESEPVATPVVEPEAVVEAPQEAPAAE